MMGLTSFDRATSKNSGARQGRSRQGWGLPAEEAKTENANDETEYLMAA